MPNVDDLKQSNFLTQKDVDPPVLVTIRSYEKVNVAMEGADPQYRYTFTFDELEKPLVLNSTNGQIIAMVVGSGEFDEWIGHKIVLYREPNIFFGGKLVGGIRCREPKQQAQPAQNVPTPDPSITELPTGTANRYRQQVPPTGKDIPF